MDPKKITLHCMLSREDLLRVTTFGADSQAESTLKTFEEIPIDRDSLERLTQEVLGLLRTAASGGYASTDLTPLSRMKELGRDLYRELIPPSLREKLHSAAGGDLTLSIEGGLMTLPWEMLHDGEGFFCRRFRVGRILSVAPAGRRGEKKALSKPLRFLSVADSEGNLEGAYREGMEIRDLLLRLDGGTVEPVFLARSVRRGDLLEGLKRCDIFHFAGHVALHDPGCALGLVDGPLAAARIEESAGRHPGPSMVFINGCRSSEADGAALLNPLGIERVQDLASGFLLSGARHFLGTLWDIRDSVARQGGLAFFHALFSGRTVGEALLRARESLAATFGELSMVWAGYILYGDPGFRINGSVRGHLRWVEEIARTDSLRKSCLQSLDSLDPMERFLAAVALYQHGDQRGLPVLAKEKEQLFDLMEGSLSERRTAQIIVNALGGSETGFRAEDPPEIRKDARNRLLSWLKTLEARL